METHILKTNSNEKFPAIIKEASLSDMPLKKDKWQFTWRSLFKTEGAQFYKLITKEQPAVIQGMLMLTVMYKEMLFMNNIEVAPHNLGSKGEYDDVAGCLIAFGCAKSFELGRNSYKGYLTFESKTKLIPLYQKKYKATLAMGQKMFIEPKSGIELIEEFLNK